MAQRGAIKVVKCLSLHPVSFPQLFQDTHRHKLLTHSLTQNTTYEINFYHHSHVQRR